MAKRGGEEVKAKEEKRKERLGNYNKNKIKKDVNEKKTNKTTKNGM